jgi:hypothetical protein
MLTAPNLAPNPWSLIEQRDALPAFGGGTGGSQARWPATHDNDLELRA